MMKRGWTMFWIGLMIAVAVATYAMKDSAGRSADRVAALKASIAGEKQQLAMLRAEWGVLDQPSRLQSLVERYNSYLQLQPLDVRQLASMADLPARAPGSDPIGNAAEPLTASLAPRFDPVRTGAIDGAADPSARPKPAKPPLAHRPVSPGPVTAAAKPRPLASPAELQTGYLE